MKKIIRITLMLSCWSLINAQTDARLIRGMMEAESVTLLAPGLISTQSGEYSPTYDSRRSELYFMRRTPGAFDYTIYRSQLTERGWSTPEIAPFSGVYRDAAPYLSPDGNTIYFDSRRPGEGVADNSISLWYAKRTANGWGKVELLSGPSINAKDEPDDGLDEYGPAVDEAGNLYFYSFRQPYRGGAHYLATPPSYQEVVRNTSLPDPSARTFISYLYVSPNGQLALLEGRAEGRNDTDIYCSCKTPAGNWTLPQAIPEINTRANEGGPSMSTDEQFILFTSDRKSTTKAVANANLYLIQSTSLLEKCTKGGKD